jgi:hypothetical protein
MESVSDNGTFQNLDDALLIRRFLQARNAYRVFQIKRSILVRAFVNQVVEVIEQKGRSEDKDK